MRKNLRRAGVLAVGAGALVLIPASIATASAFGNGAHRNGDTVGTCTYDQQRDRLQLRDGTGVRHDGVQNDTVGTGHAYRSGPMDGSGPQAVRPLDGSGNRWGTA